MITIHQDYQTRKIKHQNMVPTVRDKNLGTFTLPNITVIILGTVRK